PTPPLVVRAPNPRVPFPGDGAGLGCARSGSPPEPVERWGNGDLTHFRSRAPELGAVRPFDGVRGVGVWLVLLQHAWAISDSFSGYIALFFVLRGFLITTLIFEEQRSTGTVSLRNFYARRGIRLLPGLLVVLVVFWVPIALLARDLLGFVTLESLSTLFY